MVHLTIEIVQFCTSFEIVHSSFEIVQSSFKIVLLSFGIVHFIFDRSFSNPFLLGSECSITCPLKNQQAYCKSSKGKRSFTCEKNGWSSNSKNDCECKTACSSPEEQFPHIEKGIFDEIIPDIGRPVWISKLSTLNLLHNLAVHFEFEFRPSTLNFNSTLKFPFNLTVHF